MALSSLISCHTAVSSKIVRFGATPGLASFVVRCELGLVELRGSSFRRQLSAILTARPLQGRGGNSIRFGGAFA